MTTNIDRGTGSPKKMLASVLLLLLAAGSLPSTARADACAALSKPKTFDAASAMKAVYCEYDAAHEGTLIPVKFTRGWQAGSAKVLATPLLAVTYHEGGVQKGVLAVQRQELEDGEPMGGHTQGAAVAVYVFREQEGHFVFEKGTKEVLNAGSFGTAPEGRLVRLGEERFGLWFDGGYMNQGYETSYALVVSLSDPRILMLGQLDLSRSNGGACTQEKGDGREPCWGYEGRPELVPVAGEPFAVLRVQYSGTDKPENGDKIVPKNGAACWAKKGDKYQLVDDAGCEKRKGAPGLKMFGMEESGAKVAPREDAKKQR